jgi:(5-formylfuran-3-yl)methyl phosphate synthase
MADTADKQAGSLFDAVPLVELRRFVAQVRASGRLVGLAGALRTVHLPSVLALAPDFAGFRSAVCIGDRATALCPERLAALAGLLHGQAAVEPASA